MTAYDQFVRAKQVLRQHPDWSDERVAESLGIHNFDIVRTVAVARQELVQTGEWKEEE